MCRVCAARKNPHRFPRAPLQVYNVGVPMERVAMDILGALPVSNRGNKVVGDYFSMKSYAIPNQEASTVARVFVEELYADIMFVGELNASSSAHRSRQKLLGRTLSADAQTSRG